VLFTTARTGRAFSRCPRQTVERADRSSHLGSAAVALAPLDRLEVWVVGTPPGAGTANFGQQFFEERLEWRVRLRWRTRMRGYRLRDFKCAHSASGMPRIGVNWHSDTLGVSSGLVRPGKPAGTRAHRIHISAIRVRERVVRRYRFRPITHSGRGQAYAFSVPWLPNGVLPRARSDGLLPTRDFLPERPERKLPVLLSCSALPDFLPPFP